jgi:hypothetical protein
MGVPWPSPRFVDNGNGTISDNLTGLVWLKNSNCFGRRQWTTALTNANTLASGACGLTDGSAAGDWRLPNKNELKSLVNRRQPNPAAWLNSVGFTGVDTSTNGYSYEYYWTSSTQNNTAYAWTSHFGLGVSTYHDKGYNMYMWPVRGWQ